MDSREVRLENARQAISRFCKEFGNKIIGVMLYGSYAKGKETEKSDVDVIIVDDGIVNGRRIQKTVDGFELQVTQINYMELLQKLTQSPHTQHPFLPISVGESQILFDHFGMCAYLKNIANNIVARGPQPAEKAKVELIRTGIVNYLHDGTNEKYIGNSKVENVMWASQSIKLCMELLLAKSGDWIHYTSKLKTKILNSTHPTETQNLLASLDELLSDFDTGKFAQKVKSSMSQHISLDWDTKGPEHSAIL